MVISSPATGKAARVRYLKVPFIETPFLVNTVSYPNTPGLFPHAYILRVLVMEILVLVLQVTMPRPMLDSKILVPSLMRFVELPVKPTMLPLRHGALVPSLMRIA